MQLSLATRILSSLASLTYHQTDDCRGDTSVVSGLTYHQTNDCRGDRAKTEFDWFKGKPIVEIGLLAMLSSIADQ